MSNPVQVDVLAIAAHRDDVEQTCGGTLLVQAALGWRTGILDLTRGESGTRGTAAERETEAYAAAAILKVSHREALNLPDGNVQNTLENRLKWRLFYVVCVRASSFCRTGKAAIRTTTRPPRWATKAASSPG